MIFSGVVGPWTWSPSLSRGGRALAKRRKVGRSRLALHGGNQCFGLSFSSGWEGKPGDWSWWRDGSIFLSKGVPLKTKYHVFSTALNGSVNWLWSVGEEDSLSAKKKFFFG